MPLVRRMESCGSRSGKTLKPLVIADCGELPSQRQILAKRKAEIEENASLRKDPIQVWSHKDSTDAELLGLQGAAQPAPDPGQAQGRDRGERQPAQGPQPPRPGICVNFLGQAGVGWQQGFTLERLAAGLTAL